MRLSDAFGTEISHRENLKNDIMFNLRCCIPCIVQSYNSEHNTVECQPVIKERIINQNEEIEYMNLPLLVDVPVAYPQSSSYGVYFPLQRGDECLVVFSDLSIDNFWVSGGVENPVEERRHDLSDGIAIPCCLSLPKRKVGYPNGLTLYSSDDIYLAGSFGVKSASKLLGG